jgi:hypothetical protein
MEFHSTKGVTIGSLYMEQEVLGRIHAAHFLEIFHSVWLNQQKCK